jgi:hypothetical protein
VTKGRRGGGQHGAGAIFHLNVLLYIYKRKFFSNDGIVLLNVNWGDSEATRVSRALKLPL